MPQSAEDYVHRIGRTGRAGNKGLAISLVMNSEKKLLAQIEKYLSTRININIIEKFRPEPMHKPKSSTNKPKKIKKRRVKA